ncbi:MAG: MaoC family dehydratase N-terminal domain-containing protein [Stappiaceae bacterium]
MTASQNSDAQDLQDWVGREISQHDILQLQPARFLQATLDLKPTLEEGDALPPLWHWLYFLEASRQGELGRDGHPRKGGFLPPVPLPRRMWAGGRFIFDKPVILGRPATKRSQIKSVTSKEGRSGRLCFVTVLHEIHQDDQLMLSEEHDIVYREDPDPHAPQPLPAVAPDDPEFSHSVVPTEVMLFRYSALTFNGHRIHYDVDYAREVEGYKGLVFHGPLTATLLLELACSQMKASPKSYEFRGTAPLSGPSAFTLEGRRDGGRVDLWAKRNDGALAMSATAQF